MTTQTPMTRAMETIKRLRAQLDAAAGAQPLAVVGVGLRLPGGIHDLDGYWEALATGRDLVQPLPHSRKGPFAEQWEGLPQRGGFLDEVLEFDAEAFGISPREARGLDPQHRLLLEVTAEALDDAALPRDRMQDTRAGLYIGITGQDYRDWMAGEPDASWATGNGHCFAAGRIAYTMGLTGPAVALDTACSSSLVAVHLARQALRRGECDLAIAGGVNLVLSPRSTRLVEQTRSLAPDGLCKSFDARANGFTRGEGAGVVVLKRLDDALRDGDRVHAVVRGSAVNQDGRSTGFTAPNVLAQIALIRAALADAELTPADIGLVEAHGTGTALGDPIEMEAVLEALGRRNGGARLHVGSVKANLGHLESAAGIAGLLKGILCLQRRQVPPLVHFRTLNPRIDLAGTGVALAGALEPWGPAGDCAGVSSFGMSGTNAHVILGPAGAPAAVAEEEPVTGFELSARTPEALRALAGRLGGHLAGAPAADYPAFAYTVTAGRPRFAERARITAADPLAAGAALAALAADEPSAAVSRPGSEEEALAVPARRVVSLPGYPWQRQRYAPEPASVEPMSPELTGHELAWRQAVLPEPAADAHALVLAGDDAELLELLARQASALGLRGVLLGGAPVPGWEHAALPDGADSWSAFWAGRPAGERVALVLAFAATPLPAELGAGPDPAARGAALCTAVTAAVHGLDRGSAAGAAWAVTRGARQVTGADPVAATDHGLLHGLAPALGLEFPASWGGVCDLPAAPGAADAAALLRLVRQDGGEDLAAVRGGGVLVGRLREVAVRRSDAPAIRPDASYLVTGGLGAIGREAVTELVRRGARHLLLIGRTPQERLAGEAEALLRRLRADGVDVRYRSADCDSAAELAEACRETADLPPVRGVVHTAGALPRQPLAEADADTFATALRGKFTGAWWLHLIGRDWPLDFFTQTSSVSALWGTEGYGAYGAANGGLDALAEHRAAAGRPAVSVAFGPWALAGMADAAERAELARLGVGALDGPTGRAHLLDRPAGAGRLAVACPVDWARFAEVTAVRRRRPLFEELAPAQESIVDVTSNQVALVAEELLALPELARPAAARGRVAGLVAAVLGHAEGHPLREDVGFFDLGLDSIMAVDLERELSAVFGVRVPVAEIFDHPTVARLADHVLALLTPRPVAPRPVETPPPLPAPAATPAPVPVAAAGPAPAVAAEPIAIVGMAGRFPGADSVEEFWQLLIEGRDGVGPVPDRVWDRAALTDADPLRPGTITTDQGGFLRDPARFDAAFFDIPAREAESLDPQHRLLLEVAWHALEDGRIDPRALRDSSTGVWLGISNSDYARLLEQGGPEQLDAYFSTGTALNAAAGRLSYLLGLTGPALAVDTACSSSLVALHLAIRSLRSGETDCAITAGVNVIAAPAASVAVSRAHMLSPDGRCKTFSAEADGFVRSEGCGVLVLKRLGDARRDGDRVLALLHGSAVNQDGASSGLTAPNGRAQQAVIGAALADAGVDGSAVSYLEAHGTGTSLGDPIELRAAWSVLGADRHPGEPLLIGSVKSNIGHCESASGMASVIKTVLALRHQRIPGNLHCETRNPHVPWREMNLRVCDTEVPWRAGERPRLAGVSGFGFSGTNAHLVIGEAADAPSVPFATTDAPVLLPLSAPDEAGLERLTAAWEKHLTDLPAGELPAAAVTAGSGRAHFPVRRALLGRDREELLAALRGPTTPHRATRAPRVAFLFSGQGSQHFGMGRELYATEPVFRAVIDACDRVTAPQLGVSLHQVMFHGAEKELVNQTRFTQPALVALELGLAALWESWGVTASAVLGHSVGEIAAAIHAGVMDLETGLTLITHRARLMQETAPGAMLAVSATSEQVQEWLDGFELDVAAVNGPQAVVVAGAPEEVARFAARMKEQRVVARPLVVSHAFHSRLMEPMLGELRTVLEPFEFGAPRIPLIANVTGELATPATYGADYWAEHVRRPVRFHQGAQRLAELEIDLCLELGPDRTLGHLVTAAGLAPAGGTLPSLRRGGKDRAILAAAARTLYEHGQELNWARVQAGSSPQRGAAPRYPFAETAYWTTVRPRPAAAPAARAAHWGAELRSPALSGRAFAFERTAEFPGYLTDHRLYGTVVTPAASHLGTLLSALAGGGRPFAIEDLVCPRALVIKDGERYEAQILLADGELTVQSLIDREENRWERHLAARLGPTAGPLPALPDRDAFIADADRHITGAAFYSYFRELGYTLGPSFQWIADVWIRGSEALVRYQQPQLPDDPADYEVYPGLIDSCFQSIAGFMVDDEAAEAPSLAIPFAAARLAFPGRPEGGGELWGHVRVTKAEPLPHGRSRVETADLHLFTGAGTTVFTADGFRVRHAPKAVLEQSLRGGTPHAHELVWAARPERAAGTGTRHRVLVLGRPDEWTASLAEALAALGHDASVAADATALDAATGLVLDTRFGQVAEAAACDALDAAVALARTLREEAPRSVPYAVLGDGRAAAAPVREALWGMLAALEAEDAERRLLRITPHPELARDARALAALLAAELDAGLPELRLALDPDGPKAARLVPLARAGAEPRWRGGVLVTGGLGALGLSVARTLAEQGAPALTLMGRSAPDETARRVIDELVAAGVEVTVTAGDVTDPEDCARAVRAAEPLCAVFHLAGVNRDGAFENLTADSFEQVFAAKARGAEHLAAAARGAGLDAFVLFSSVSSVLGSAGQANYAAANGYLNGLAQALRDSGVPATSVAWGPWVPADKGGMAAAAAVERATERLGVRPLDDAEAGPLLALAAGGERAGLVAVALDPQRYAERLAGHPRGALLAGSAPVVQRATGGRERGWLLDRLTGPAGAGRDAELRGAELRDAIRDLVGEVLGDPARADDTIGFADLGLDSIMVIDLRTQLAHALGTELPATVAIDHPTVAALADYVTGSLFAEAPVPEAAVPDDGADQGDPRDLSFEELIRAVQNDLEA
ncbi:type I polyketide synthase [Kitasatospora viridis]|uniref:Acyl transferase domain-containing protein n=1 Tax=Kitasatospora viridis TaxID=281105 RepID=A0A561UJU1_9ACTN|nr:type I polyketide synthase [Kitasatospora viridis]TWF99634.1 acyl transferase domain-containing protein [Kitasatospora viridis]